jgi:hypothetical protein
MLMLFKLLLFDPNGQWYDTRDALEELIELATILPATHKSIDTSRLPEIINQIEERFIANISLVRAKNIYHSSLVPLM